MSLSHAIIAGDIGVAGRTTYRYHIGGKMSELPNLFYAIHHSRFYEVGLVLCVIFATILGVRNYRKKALGDSDQKILIK
jgi:hypothetical protein